MSEKKIAVVTGGARGIGKAIALELAKAGNLVVINYNGSEEKARETKAEIEAAGGQADILQCNVADFDACEAFFKAVAEKYGRVDILVNNAGVTKDGLLMKMSEEDFSRVVDINLKGTFNCIRHVSRMMLKQRSGRIISLSSVVGLRGNAGQANYAASKAGIIGLTKSAAKELASRGITVNAIAPGFIKTDMTDVLSDKVKELNNVQVILRGTRAEDNYMFSIIGRDALQILKQEKVQKALKYLEQHPYVKLSNEFVNVHESVVMNILQYHKQYSLLNQILKESLENTGVIPTAYWVFVVQLCTSIEKRMEVNVGSISEELEQSQQGIEEKLSKAKEGIFMSRIKMRDAGYKLRKEILLAKKAENDECMRGTIYQLLNALSVRNEGKFMDIVIRLYSSTKLPMADGFVYMLGNKEKFSEYGYSFILGLKGSYTDSKDSKSEDTKQSQDESGEEN